MTVFSRCTPCILVSYVELPPTHDLEEDACTMIAHACVLFKAMYQHQPLRLLPSDELVRALNDLAWRYENRLSPRTPAN